MLNNLNLDDEKFSDILEKGTARIPELTSEWTDFNAHDPGITFLELLTWKKEMQQFRMDQIGEDNLRSYLELLGGTPREKQSAEALLHIPAGEEILFPQGTPFYAGDIRFETTEEEYLSSACISSLTCRQGTSVTAEYEISNIQGNLGIPLFGNPAAEGNSFTLWFSGPLKTSCLQHIWFDMKPVSRNPFTASFLPLAEIGMEVLTLRGWESIKPVRDDTHAFLTDGRISFYLPGEMQKGAKGYPIRFCLKRAEYDTLPVLMHIGIHRIQVAQKHTLARCGEFNLTKEGKELPAHLENSSIRSRKTADPAEADQGTPEKTAEFSGNPTDYYRKDPEGYRLIGEFRTLTAEAEAKLRTLSAEAELLAVSYDSDFYENRILGIGTGFPHQSYPLPVENVSGGEFRLLVEEEPGSGLYREWQMVRHPERSGPEDPHFALEEDTVCFGSGYHGRMPEGEIRILSCHTCQGKAGNVRANTITGCGDQRIRSLDHEAAAGGADGETLEEALQRTTRELEQEHAAVTPEDYCALAKSTPGLSVKACQAELARDGENKIILSVAQDNMEQKVSDAFLRNVEKHLEKRIPIGTEVKVLPCRRIGISVFMEVCSKAYGKTVKAQIRAKLEEYFQEREEQAGGILSGSELYQLLESLESVGRIRTISLEARAGGVGKKDNGDLQLPPGGLAYLKELQCMVVSAE